MKSLEQLQNENACLAQALKIGYLALSDILGAADNQQPYSIDELHELFINDYNTMHDVLLNANIITV